MRCFIPLVALVLALPTGDAQAGVGTGFALPETRVCGEDNPMPFPRPKYFAEWNWNALAARRNGRTDEELGWYRVGMEANDPTSFEWAGLVYEEGRCTLPRDPAKAAEHYRRAGELGKWTSLIRLGLLTLTGDGVPANVEQADALFRRGLIRVLNDDDMAYPREMIERHILRGRPMPVELERRLAWWEETIKLPPSSAPQIAADFLDRNSSAYDPVAGCKVIERGGYKDDGAAFALYRLLTTGAEGLKAKPRLADYWLMNAAINDYGPAHAELGRRLWTGDRAQKLRRAAYRHLRVAEQSGEEVSDLLRQVESDLPAEVIEDLRTHWPWAPSGVGLTYEYPSLEQPACERAP